jgi:hypothetical protein
MEYEIHTQCPECEGRNNGILEYPSEAWWEDAFSGEIVAVKEFKESYCYECDGSGLVMHTEVYDSEEDAKADYPESFIKPSKWNRALAVERGQMIADQILGPTLGFKQ